MLLNWCPPCPLVYTNSALSTWWAIVGRRCPTPWPDVFTTRHSKQLFSINISSINAPWHDGILFLPALRSVCFIIFNSTRPRRLKELPNQHSPNSIEGGTQTGYCSAQAQAQVFVIDKVKLKKVENLKYLGRQNSSGDSDFPTLFPNLSKAWKCLTHISCLLARGGASPYVGRSFYYVAAIVSVLLLYGSETWVWSTPTMLNIKCGFHHCDLRVLQG